VALATDDEGRLVELPTDVGRTDFTIELWFKLDAGFELPLDACNNNPTNLFTGLFIVDRDMLGAGDHGDWVLTVFDGVIGFGAGLTTYGRAVCLQVAGWDPAAWTFVVATLEHGQGGANGNVRLYAYQPAPDIAWSEVSAPEDVPEGSDFSYDETRVETDARNAEVRLGGTKWIAERSGQCMDVCRGITGHIDEIRMSNIARYELGVEPVPLAPFEVDGDTAALYHFDEGTGDTAFDSAAVPTDGELVGDASWSSETPFE